MKLASLPFLACSFLAPLAAAQGGGPGTPGTGGVVPTLSISSPELGSVVTATVADALPGATVGLAYSPQAGQFGVPQGTVWLDPSSVQLVASGVTDAQGEATFSVAVPLAKSLAEREVHLQAYVVDPGAVAGAALTNSLDFRLLGSRLYIGLDVYAVGERLLVKSAVTDLDVFVTDFSSFSPRPVFDAGRSLGATVTAPGGEIRIFDNFFGDTVHTVPAGFPDGLLIADATKGVFYIRSVYRIDRVEFATGAVTGSVILSEQSLRWVGNEAGTEAYLTHHILGQPFVRRVDLANLADLGTTPVGSPGDSVAWIGQGNGTVVVLTKDGFSPPVQAILNRIDYSGAVPSVTQTDVGGSGSSGIAVPASDAVLAWQVETCGPSGGPPFEMFSAPLSSAGPATPAPSPMPPFGAGCITPVLTAVQGPFVWFADRCCHEYPFGDDPGALWRLDTATLTWSAPLDMYEGPDGVTLVEDAFASRVFTANHHFSAPAFPADLTATDSATFVEKTVEYDSVVVTFVVGTFHGESIP